MSERFENKIQRLKLDNFTCFSKTIFEFSSGINVFIGENGTGKTHILKALYGMSSTISSPEFQQLLQADFVSLTKTAEVIGTQPHYLYETFFSTFSAKTPKDFIKYDETETEIELLVNGAGFGFHIDKKIVAPIISLDNSLSVKPLFIPSKEIISTQRGFIPYYLKQVNDYDRTYFDLAVNLQSTELKNPPIDLLRDFEDALGFSVVLKQDGFFYIKDKFNKETKSTFEAEGIRKLAQVLRLVMNGSLAKDTILFWDEPEVNLNPRYIKSSYFYDYICNSNTFLIK